MDQAMGAELSRRAAATLLVQLHRTQEAMLVLAEVQEAAMAVQRTTEVHRATMLLHLTTLMEGIKKRRLRDGGGVHGARMECL